MARTTKVEFDCNDAHITPSGTKSFTVSAEGADTDAILDSINRDQLVNWIMAQNFSPEDFFSQTELQNWAESDGYVKP